MDFSTQEWLTVLIVVLIVGIFLDGFRRMRNARRDSLKMSLKLKNKACDYSDEDIAGDYGSEFPNGGARTSEKKIDKDRIAKVKSKFDFGSDMSRLTRGFNQAIDKITDRTDDDRDTAIEPTIDDSFIIEDEPVSAEQAFVDNVDVDDNIDEVEAAILSNSQNQSQERVDSDGLISDGLTEEAPAEDLRKDLPKQEVYSEPQQVPLNLDDNVPMLMETADEELVAAASKIEGEDLNIRSVAKHVGHDESLDEVQDGEPEALDTHSANKPRYLSKADKENIPAEKSVAGHRENKAPKSESSITEEVLVLHVNASEDSVFQGADLLQLILANGLRYGAMNIFHRHADEEGEGPILFSMANMVMPGVFDLKTFDDFSTVGVSFFLTLPVDEGKNMLAFDTMLLTAKNIIVALGGELKDDQRSVMTGQTVEHYRERIRDFSRRQQLEKRLEQNT